MVTNSKTQRMDFVAIMNVSKVSIGIENEEQQHAYINMNKCNFCYLHLYYLPRRFARKEGMSTSQ